jgi:excisionase family DNA binding protein
MDGATEKINAFRRNLENGSESPTAIQPSHACLTYDDLSTLTGLSLSTLRRRVKEGKLPFIQPGGRRTRIVFPRDVMEQLLQPVKPVCCPSGATNRGPVSPDGVSARREPTPSPPTHGPLPRWLQEN